MYITQLRLVAEVPERAVGAELAEAFWESRAPDDGVEHVTVRPAPDGVWLTLFLLAGSQMAADRAGRGFCARVLRLAPELLGWRLLPFEDSS